MIETARETIASREYYKRPGDQHYDTLAALVADARQERELCSEMSKNWRDLRFDATGQDPKTAGLTLSSKTATAVLTHWSFAQANRMLGAPTAFVRDSLSPEVAAQVLNYRITDQPHGVAPVLLMRRPNGKPEPTVRAITSKTYGRVWDAHLYGDVLDRFGDRWTNRPPTGPDTILSRSDRDSFVTLCEPNYTVVDPSTVDGTMYRGLLIRNSEVGACSVVIDAILYRSRCRNLMIWTPVLDRSFRRRHVGSNTVRDTMREINRIAYAWTQRSADQDEAIIRGLVDRDIADTRNGVIDELEAIGFSREAAGLAYDKAEGTETASPRSYWGIVQGITRISQLTPYQDERHDLDKLAAKVLARGRALVAA